MARELKRMNLADILRDLGYLTGARDSRNVENVTTAARCARTERRGNDAKAGDSPSFPASGRTAERSHTTEESA